MKEDVSMKRKFLALILSVLMLVSLMPTMALAAPAYGDTDGHWAESSINRWSGYGIVQGADGMFDPNGQLTCAQLATILVNLLKLPAAPSAGFTDNPDGSWFADAINRCAAAGILLGNGDGTVAPTQSSSRDRTMVMLARALGVEPVANPDLSNYSDAAKVAPYAAGYVAALVDAGVVNGLTETELAPQEEINRASTVTILDKAISTYADKDGATVNVTDGKGITLIVADNVTVKGTVETLVVASSDANVKLDGVTAEKVAVTGEGNKVELANSKVETVVASGEKSAVETSGKTTVETVSIAAADASMSVGKGSTVETLTVTEAAANAEVKVASGASVQALETAAEKTTVDNSGVIATATIAESATGTEVKANSGSYTGTVKTEAADTTVGGTGAVAKVEASGSAASGEGAANVTTQGTTTEKTDASGATSTDTNTGKIPATDSANSEAAKDAAAGTGNDTPTTAPSTPSGGGHSHSYAYTDNGDGTHTGTCSCGAKTEAAAHVVGEDSKCSVCNVELIVRIGTVGYTSLQDALNAGGEIVLLEDIDVTDTLIVNNTVTLDMNGKKLSNAKDIWNETTGAWSLVSVRESGNLTVTGNGTFAAKENDCYAIDLYDEGTQCTIKNGTYLGNIAAVYVYKGHLTVNGGTFNIQQLDNSQKPYGFVLNCRDEYHKDGSATITVNGGSFYKFDPSISKSENPEANFVPVGYGVISDNVWYTVVPGTGTDEKPFQISSADQLKAFRDSVNAGNSYSGKFIQLTANINLNGEVWTPIGPNADAGNKFQGTFDGNGKTISNLKVDTATGEAQYQATGFFGALNGVAKNFTIDGATIIGMSKGNNVGNTDNGIAVVAGSIYTSGSIEGVTVKNATVSGNRYVGGISGYTYGSVKNCTVENVTLTATPDKLTGSYDNGDKVGGIVGTFWHENTHEISGNTAKNVTITGYRDMGGIVGYANGNVTNNTVNGLTLIQDYSILTTPRTTVEAIIGRHDGFEVDKSNTSSNVTKTTQVGSVLGSAENPYTLDEFNALTKLPEGRTELYVNIGNVSLKNGGVTIGNESICDIWTWDSDTSHTPGEVLADGRKVYMVRENDTIYSSNKTGITLYISGSVNDNPEGGLNQSDSHAVTLKIPDASDVVFTKDFTVNGYFRMFTGWSDGRNLGGAFYNRTVKTVLFDHSTFNGIWIQNGGFFADSLTLDGCTFNAYQNKVSANDSNPLWFCNIRSCDVTVTNCIFEASRPIKVVEQTVNGAKVTITGNQFDMSLNNSANDASKPKNDAIMFSTITNTSTLGDVVVSGNTVKGATALLTFFNPSQITMADGATFTVSNNTLNSAQLSVEWKTTTVYQPDFVTVN